MKLSIIVAMDRNRVIGRDGQLPWRLSSDLQRFKQLTMGHPMIMGRKTYDSIGRPLPGRRSLVISRQPGYSVPGVTACGSLEEAFSRVADAEEAFVIGGGEVYSQALPRADRLYVTAVEAEVAGDTYFPAWNLADWRLVQETSHPADAKNSHAIRFLVFDRTHTPGSSLP